MTISTSTDIIKILIKKLTDYRLGPGSRTSYHEFRNLVKAGVVTGMNKQTEDALEVLRVCGVVLTERIRGDVALSFQGNPLMLSAEIIDTVKLLEKVRDLGGTLHKAGAPIKELVVNRRQREALEAKLKSLLSTARAKVARKLEDEKHQKKLAEKAAARRKADELQSEVDDALADILPGVDLSSAEPTKIELEEFGDGTGGLDDLIDSWGDGK